MESGYCTTHRRASASKRLYGYRWQVQREWFLQQPENALCRDCLAQGITTAATDVDHVIPHRGDLGLFWDQDNWQSLCKSCHSRKTAQGL